MNPLDIYKLTIGNEICADNFLPIKWAESNLLGDMDIVKSAIKIDRVDILEYLCSRRYKLSFDTTYYVAKYGSIKCLRYLYKESYVGIK